MFSCVVVSVLILPNILLEVRELDAELYLVLRCHLTVNVLCILLTVSRIDLQCALVSFPSHTHLFNTKPKLLQIST